jgi:transposase
LMWLTGMNNPDHNTLWRFFSDNKPAIKELFKRSVQVAIKNDLVGMVYHAIDGTKVGADASRYKGLNKEEMKLLLHRLDEYVEAMARSVEAKSDVEPDDRLPAQLQDAKLLQQTIQKNVVALSGKENGSLSLSDMDSRKMRTNRGTVEFSYNAQAAVDQKNGVIVGAEVSQAETDHHLLSAMLDEVKETTGANAQSSVADAGYFSGEELAKVEEARPATEVYVNIPEEHNRSAEKSGDNPYHSNNFIYDKARDVYICPHGKTLERAGADRGYVEYGCAYFPECPYKEACTTSKKRKRIRMHGHHESIRRHKRKIANESARALLRQRGSLIERVFGWIKEQYGLRRLTSCGLDNAKAVWYLACTIYNLRKIWACTSGIVKAT